MITQVIQYKNLDETYKGMFQEPLDDERILYIVKSTFGEIKSITTSVLEAIKKTQAK